MGKRFSKVNSVASGFMRLAGLVLVAFLLIVVISRTGTAQPDQNIATAPVSTVQATIWLPTVTPNPPAQTTGTVLVPERSMERDYGAWSFGAASATGYGVSAMVKYDHDSVQSLIDYALANRALATQLATRGGQVEVRITFNTFVTPEEFREWVATRGLTIQRSTLRTAGPNGREGTMGQGAHEGDTGPLPEERLYDMVDPGWAIRGVYFTIATVDAIRLPELALDPLVFVADLTPYKVRDELIAAGWPGAEQATVYIDAETPFWAIEDLGLENFTP